MSECGHNNSDIYNTRLSQYCGYAARKMWHQCRECAARWVTFELRRGDLNTIAGSASKFAQIKDLLS